MAPDRPILDHMNLVVRDMDSMIAFYSRLGVEIAPSAPPWDRHHRTIQNDDRIDFDLDSATFAVQWNAGWPSGQTGPVIGFRVERRESVDAIYDDLTSAGYTGQQAPYDAFWGARYAVIVDPEGNSVGLMSAADPERRTAPPSPAAT